MDTKTSPSFRDTFKPIVGGDYKWVVSFAREEYVRAIEVFKRLDDKAAAVANYLGAGTGVLTLGSLAGVTADKVPTVVIVTAIPSVIAAMLALRAAAQARMTTDRGTPPTVDVAALYVADFPAKGATVNDLSEAETRFIVEWNECIEMLYKAVADKGKKVDRALRYFVWAVYLLALPLSLSLYLRSKELVDRACGVVLNAVESYFGY